MVRCTVQIIVSKPRESFKKNLTRIKNKNLKYKIHLFTYLLQFRGKIFWLPHNMDFRGRVYPIPPHLTHLGSDLARSILIFALKKPLGPNGLDWLKLHVINLTGLKKKESISERLKYADEIMDEIIDSAEKPLTVSVLLKKKLKNLVAVITIYFLQGSNVVG